MHDYTGSAVTILRLAAWLSVLPGVGYIILAAAEHGGAAVLILVIIIGFATAVSWALLMALASITESLQSISMNTAPEAKWPGR
jgi:hypothetical protein